MELVGGRWEVETGGAEIGARITTADSGFYFPEDLAVHESDF